MSARPLIPHGLSRRVNVDGLAGRVCLAIMLGQVVLRIEVGAANDAVVLVGMCHRASKVAV